MNALLMDIGNTRLKWASYRRARLGRAQARRWTARTLQSVLREALRSAAGVERIVVCNVAGAAVARALRAAARSAALPAPVFVRSTRRAAGVRNGYGEPWRLGVDRWVAAIGAYHSAGSRRAVLVADVGTALTIDLVDRRGRHRGGAIVPGPALMVRSLLTQTVGIRRRASGGGARRATLFARSTAGALHGGALHACAALIEHALGHARGELGRAPALYLTGGAARAVSGQLHRPMRVHSDLVLEGLAVLATGAAALV